MTGTELENFYLGISLCCGTLYVQRSVLIFPLWFNCPSSLIPLSGVDKCRYFRIFYHTHKVAGILPLKNLSSQSLLYISTSCYHYASIIHIWIIIPAPSLARIIPGHLGLWAALPEGILDTVAHCTFLQCCLRDFHPSVSNSPSHKGRSFILL